MQLITITKVPITKNILFTGSFAVNIAEKGAVTIPPINKPKIIFQCWIPKVKKKVIAAVKVKINFATVELPTANLGVKEFLIKVPVTNGPPSSTGKRINKNSEKSETGKIGFSF